METGRERFVCSSENINERLEYPKLLPLVMQKSRIGKKTFLSISLDHFISCKQHNFFLGGGKLMKICNRK